MTPDGDRQAAATYLRIADDLRRQITSGDLAPGTQMPSELKLTKLYGASRPTVRQALDVLHGEQLIDKIPTVGTFVRRRPALTTRSSTRYARQPGETSPFARDAKREGARPDWDHETNRIRAGEDVAARLGLEVGVHVMRTHYLFRADGRPIQTSTSWEPFEIVGGTAIEEPEEGPGSRGVVARFDTIDVRIDRVVERVRARPATEEERRQLDIPEGVWVQQIERTHYAGDQAVETADITVPADRYELEFVIPVE
ncbi:GntR family transcriptional regulator [Pseudofrankia sp. BMG5.37]|uniref:GntR family transcriptional regulator n=1 Tax=Pseudofrankia sp. BMG5.37 TaxID=3050035 RepID=UPI0028938E94|nr:GntR family transcriptional regulator [Pseudofrankia sp. BMG5.37]MDT3438342.1 GntR family transcriptional regulator [Pseudofrankia sp. BMG5.37]